MKPVSATGPQLSSLREEQKAVARRRICDAARELFFLRGFAQATIEDIAATAGVRRSTLYNYFHDKEEILAAVADEYVRALSEIMSCLPGPVPSRADIDRWLGEVAAFVSRERIPTVLLTELGHSGQIPTPVEEAGDKLLRALAVRVPAFQRALEPGPRQGLALAWASVILRQVSWASLVYSRDGDESHVRDLLTVTGDLLDRFVQDYR